MLIHHEKINFASKGSMDVGEVGFIIQAYFSTLFLFAGVYFVIYLFAGRASFFLFPSLTVDPSGYLPLSAPVSVYKVGFQCLWYSFVCMTTTGYGDVYPRFAVSRIFASFQMLTALFYNIVILGMGMSHANTIIFQIAEKRRLKEIERKKKKEKKIEKIKEKSTQSTNAARQRLDHLYRSPSYNQHANTLPLAKRNATPAQTKKSTGGDGGSGVKSVHHRHHTMPSNGGVEGGGGGELELLQSSTAVLDDSSMDNAITIRDSDAFDESFGSVAHEEEAPLA